MSPITQQKEEKHTHHSRTCVGLAHLERLSRARLACREAGGARGRGRAWA